MRISEFSAAMIRYAKILPFGAPNFNDPDVSNFWYESLVDLDQNSLSSAMRTLCQREKFPSIAQIRASCGLIDQSDDEIARDAVTRLRAAISRFGYMRWAEAKLYIGSVGEHLVAMLGGWDSLCGTETHKELDFTLVQAREYAKIAVKKDRAQKLSEAPDFPSLSAVNDTVQALLSASKDLTVKKR